jgi:hypothetical protein
VYLGGIGTKVKCFERWKQFREEMRMARAAFSYEVRTPSACAVGLLR